MVLEFVERPLIYSFLVNGFRDIWWICILYGGGALLLIMEMPIIVGLSVKIFQVFLIWGLERLLAPLMKFSKLRFAFL